MIYLAQEYQAVIEQAEKSLYGAGLISLPTPKCVVFYNGTKEMPEEQILKLSDAFEDTTAKADVELTVRMLNINHGHNSLLMGKCRVLKEYAEFVDITRKFMLEEKHVETALAEAVDYCIEQGIRCMVEVLQETGQSQSYIADKIAEKYALSEEAAADKLLQYWK